MMLNALSRFFSDDLGIDLGTAYTLVYARGKGIVANEPSVVVIRDEDKKTTRIVAAGEQARDMIGRTPSKIRAIKPIKDGVIADFEAAQMMLAYFIRKAHNNRKSVMKSRIMISVPLEINEIEKKALMESARIAGASQVYFMEAVIGAAIGAGLPVGGPVGSMVVDIGAGKTEVAVISLGGIVVGTPLGTGGDKMDQAIIHYIKNKYNRVMGESTAEGVKIKLGQMLSEKENGHIRVNLSDLGGVLSSTLEISTEEIKEALAPSISSIIDGIKQTFEMTPPELVADIVDSGITLTGGGALLGGLDKLIADESGLPVHIAHHPQLCVALGLGKTLENFEVLREVS